MGVPVIPVAVPIHLPEAFIHQVDKFRHINQPWCNVVAYQYCMASGTQHWSKPGLTGPEPSGGHYFILPGGPGSYAPPLNAGGPGWVGHGQPGGYYYAPR